MQIVSSKVDGRQDGVLVRRDTSHHALKGKPVLATVALSTAGALLAYNDGKGCAEVVQSTPFSSQFLCITQLCQTSFILNLEVDLGRRHVRIYWIFCRERRLISARWYHSAAGQMPYVPGDFHSVTIIIFSTPLPTLTVQREERNGQEEYHRSRYVCVQ